MLYVNKFSEKKPLSTDELKHLIKQTLARLTKNRNILIIPPDISRFPSHAGVITQYIYEINTEKRLAILPATGLHAPMNHDEIKQMFGDIPGKYFYSHDPAGDVKTIGHIPGRVMDDLTHGLWKSEWPCKVNKLLCADDFDYIISIGQVVPHEVAGMSNFNKNIFVGTGGREGIDISHYISALYGIEKTLGEIDTPVRRIFNYASDNFLNNKSILYILTVINTDISGNPAVYGLFIGDDSECFIKAAEFSRKVNITYLAKPVQKMVVYLDPLEYKSTWLGNKAIYRTRRAIKEGGELIIIAPGIAVFGEIEDIDSSIRKYGYTGTEEIKKIVERSEGLHRNLAVAAHLIHGSTDGRFSVILCPGKMKKEEVERVNFRYSDPAAMMKKYDPHLLKAGYNHIDSGEKIYFVQQPGLGLWTTGCL